MKESLRGTMFVPMSQEIPFIGYSNPRNGKPIKEEDISTVCLTPFKVSWKSTKIESITCTQRPHMTLLNGDRLTGRERTSLNCMEVSCAEKEQEIGRI
jgi:hypothetical protein